MASATAVRAVAATAVFATATASALEERCISRPPTCHPLCDSDDASSFGDPTACGDDSDWTRGAIWPGGELLASFLTPALVRGRRVLELGCGTGLPGIVAARLGASRLVLTDGTAEVLARAKQNAASNLKDVPWAAQQLNFGEVTPEDLAGKFDVLIASDVLYQSSGWRPLAQTAGELLAPNGVLLVAEAGHETSPADATLGGFRVVAEGSGLAFDEEPETLGEGGYNAKLVRVRRRS